MINGEMMKENIVQILVSELGYLDHVADITADDLINLQPQLQPILKKWLSDREVENVETNNISITQLISRGYTFPSALISMDWLLTEPEIAIKELSNELRR